MEDFSSDAFLGVMNVNATNVLGKSQYFIDRSGCMEMLLKEIEIEMTIKHSVDPYAFEVSLAFSMVTLR